MNDPRAEADQRFRQAEDAVRGAQAVLDFAAGALSKPQGAGG
jgi:hypothetical protein